MRRAGWFGLLTAAVALVMAPLSAQTSSAPTTTWLDRPLVNWNKPGAALPTPPFDRLAREQILKRCQRTLPMSTPAERALTEGGWIPFLNFDRQLLEGDVEIVGGMAGADGMCRPAPYNIFVFVRGRFAGALSPDLMMSRADASTGAVRIIGAETISAEFARFTDKDALCCPSSRVTVRYRIDRSGAQPVVAPVDVRTTRSF